MTILEARQLRKEFHLHVQGGKRICALDEISFGMEEGEALGLTGRSGSGKSSLMKCVYRTYRPSSGSLLYRSLELGTVDLAAADEHTVLELRRREMTYCSQFLQVIPRVPAVEVMAEPLMRRGVDREQALGRAREVLDRLRLPEELWDAFPATFSGGEQQRVNIGRAVIGRPRFLLLDEPTASLDQQTKDAVIGMIEELKGEGTSVMLISHDAYTMDRLAGRRLHLQEGRMEEVVHA
jgi:alpha-D-ribose 1-methylphosphonate 5-triphosphate synthase subunit PhnL